MSSRRLNYTDTKKYIKKLDAVIKDRQDKEHMEIAAEHHEIIDHVLQFVRKRRLMVYGGYAINAVLSSNDKLYKENSTADIDFFSFNARRDASDLADYIYKKGYRYVEVRVGIHYETFKLYVNFFPVADITDIPKQLFKRMQHMAKEERQSVFRHLHELDIPLAPLTFMRLALHLELSRPDGYIDRWIKVYQRMSLLYDYYPIHMKKCIYLQSEKNQRVLQLRDVILTIVRTLKIPLLGFEAVKTYLKQGGVKVDPTGILHTSMPLMDVVSLNYKDVASKIKDMLSSYVGEQETIDITAHSPLNLSELLPRHLLLTYVNKKTKERRLLITVYNSRACYSYKMLNGIKYASIDTILSFMYAWLLADRAYFHASRIKCLMTILLHIQYIHLNDGNPLFELFEQQCYGKQQSLFDLRKRLWNKKKDIVVYRPTA